MDTDQLKSIEIGLRGKLRSTQIPEAFIERNLEDLLQQAVAEYANVRERGIKVVNPGGWIVHSAHLRAIDQLRHEQHEVEGTTEDVAANMADETTPLPDEEALGHIEAEQLHRAISRLSTSQRQALSLYYFEDKSTRDGADALGWSEPTFRRRRDAAIESLRERLGVTVPEFDVGLAAWLSLTVSESRFAWATSNIGGTIETIRSGAVAVADRTREFATRLLSSGGGETAIGIGSPASKAAAGVCATALAACTATGVIGPGVASVDLIDHNTKPKPSVEKRVVPTGRGPNRPPATSTASTPSQESSRASTSQTPKRQKANGSSKSQARSEPKRTLQARHNASSQFGVESSASTTPAGGAPTTTSPPPSASAPSPSPDQAAQEQFGLP